MRTAFRLGATCAALLLANAVANAAEPVRQIGVFVKPYYSASYTLVEPPQVAVDPQYDKLLASTKRADVAKARDAIAAAPDMVKPTTLMVLAIRLYDVGLRDDAVFWFYAARDRYATMDAVLDMRSLALVGMANAVDDFTTAVAPAINGYAFCDIKQQQTQEDRAIAWVAKHPYRLLESLDMPSQVDDRNKALGEALGELQSKADFAKGFLAKPENLQEMKDLRAHNEADARFCWK